MQISSAVIHFSQTVQTAAVQQAEAAAAQANINLTSKHGSSWELCFFIGESRIVGLELA